MIEKFCLFLTKKIREKMPEVDDEQAEVINYGLQLVFGEIPKTFIMIAIAVALGIWQLAALSFLFIIPYRTFSGGFHLKTHIGCIIGTTLFYCGNVYISKYVVFEPIFIKYIAIAVVWVFSMVMIKLYAPADTENVPILRKKDRRNKQIGSYITMTITLIAAIFVQDRVISNMLIFGILIQTLAITKFMYKITKNKYGYEEYIKEQTATT